MRSKLLFIAAFGVVVTMAACGVRSAVDPLEIGDPERGREIYDNGGGVLPVGCHLCHTLDGSVHESVSRLAPSFQGISERAGDRVPELSAEEYLRQSITDPKAFVVGGFSGMDVPNDLEKVLSEEDIDALVSFLLTQ